MLRSAFFLYGYWPPDRRRVSRVPYIHHPFKRRYFELESFIVFCMYIYTQVMMELQNIAQ